MNSKLLLIVTLLSIAVFTPAQVTASTDGLSPQAQDIVKMAKAGVDESILLSYVKADRMSFALTSTNIEAQSARHAAYFSLYNGLEQYNSDLIAQSNGR